MSSPSAAAGPGDAPEKCVMLFSLLVSVRTGTCDSWEPVSLGSSDTDECAALASCPAFPIALTGIAMWRGTGTSPPMLDTNVLLADEVVNVIGVEEAAELAIARCGGVG